MGVLICLLQTTEAVVHTWVLKTVDLEIRGRIQDSLWGRGHLGLLSGWGANIRFCQKKNPPKHMKLRKNLVWVRSEEEGYQAWATPPPPNRSANEFGCKFSDLVVVTNCSQMHYESCKFLKIKIVLGFEYWPTKDIFDQYKWVNKPSFLTGSTF